MINVMEQVRDLFWAIDNCSTNDFRYYYRYAFFAVVSALQFAITE